jgi:hypothetical protein
LGQDTNRKAATTKRSPGKGETGKEGDVGNALRSVYQKAVDEAVPDDLLDLLGKLK